MTTEKQLIDNAKPATTLFEISTVKRKIQCPYCNKQGPFCIDKNLKMSFIFISCYNCNSTIFTFDLI